MRILIIEDELKTGSYLKRGLTEASFIVDLVDDGIDGLHHAMTEHYDLIITDIRLPGQDGFSILTALNAAGIKTPVFILTACNQSDDRLKGLSLGAGEYLTKPFSFAELLARVRALLRREHGLTLTPLTCSDLTLDLMKRQITRAGRYLYLTSQEYNLLALLMRHQGEVLSRAFIASQVWNMGFDSDFNVVDVAIRRLRQRIDISFSHPLIQTVRGMGYVLEQDSRT